MYLINKTIIMLCGQSSVGKSVYANNLKDYCYRKDIKSIIVSMDKLVDLYKESSWSELIEIYYQTIYSSMSEYDCIICDFSNDTKSLRDELCNYINKGYDLKDWNIIVIGLHPSFNTIIDRFIQRGVNKEYLLSNLNNFYEIYNNFHFPSKMEFTPFGFKNVIIFNLKNDLDIKKYDLMPIYQSIY